MKPRSALACTSAISLALSSFASADSFTWSGTENLFWDTTSQNWTNPGTFWPSIGTDNDAIFGATGIGIIEIAAPGILANDLTFSSAGYTIAGPGTLTLNGATNTVTATQAATISANLAGTSGLTKTGAQRLTLSGDNSALSGILAINDVTGTNNNGVWITSLASLGGITSVNIGGTPTTGGHFRLQGNNISIPSTVTFNLSGQGGNNAPAGTLIGGGTGINTIAGNININTNAVRITNSGATRLDLTGAITQNYTSSPTDSILFRFGDNEGIHLTNTANSWSVNTIHSQGTLWFDPGTLPTTTNLQIAGSDVGTIQTSGNFNRALGTAANQVQFTLNSGRAMGFGARGGDLTLNFGGAAADILFNTATGAPADTIRTSNLILNNSTATHRLTLANALNINGANRTIQVNANTAELAGGLKNSTGTFSLTKTGNGTLAITGGITGGVAITTSGGTTEISGTAANTYTGGINVNGGNLLIKRSDGLGSTAGGTTTGGGTNQGSLQFDASDAPISTAENITLGMRASLVTNSFSSMKPNINNLAGTTTLTGLLNGVTGGAVTKISSDGGLLIIAGEYRQSGASPTASTRFGHLQGSGQGEISGTITQASGITHRIDKMGTGTWTITGSNNSFSGGIRVVEGTLAATHFGNAATNSGLGTASDAPANLLLNGGTLRYTGSGESSDRLFSIGPVGGTLDASGSAALILSNTGAAISADGGGTDIQFSFATNATTIATNDTTRLAVGMELSALPGFAPGTKITGFDHTAGLVTIDTPTTAASAVLNGTALGVIDRTLTLTGTNTDTNTLNATLANAANGSILAVAKTGLGSWTLNGNSTHSGDTTVSAGTLYINGTLANSAVVVTGGTVAGSSTNLALGATIGTNGTIAPGNSIGTLTASSINLAGTYQVEYNSTTIDLLDVTGLLDITGATVTFTAESGALDGTSNYVFANYGSLIGTFGSATAPSGYTIDYAFGGNSIALVPIPEPATALLGTLGLLTLFRRHRRA